MSWNVKAKSRLPESVIAECRYIFGNIILVDIVPESLSELCSCIDFNVPMQFESLISLAQILRKQIDFNQYERILWPGTGAKTVQRLLQLNDVGENIDARRIGYKNTYVEVGEVQVKNQRTLIIDDVICSGGTVRAIQKKGQIRECDIACLVIQSPRDTNLKSFGRIFTPLMVRAERGKVPLNSFSTFLKNSDIARDYAKRFARDPDEFLEALSLIEKEAQFYA